MLFQSLFAFSSSTKESYQSQYGMCVHQDELRTQDNQWNFSEVDYIRSAGADWVRTDYAWAYMEPNEG